MTARTTTTATRVISTTQEFALTSLVRSVARAVSTALDRACCRLVGHDDSWTHGFALGYERPCCERCHRILRDMPNLRDMPDAEEYDVSPVNSRSPFGI